MALKCTPHIGNYSVYNKRNSLLGVPYSLKSFKYKFPATASKQMISLRLECQKRNKENN